MPGGFGVKPIRAARGILVAGRLDCGALRGGLAGPIRAICTGPAQRLRQPAPALKGLRCPLHRLPFRQLGQRYRNLDGAGPILHGRRDLRLVEPGQKRLVRAPPPRHIEACGPRHLVGMAQPIARRPLVLLPHGVDALARQERQQVQEHVLGLLNAPPP
jgi:hypothetical protein